MQWVVNQLLIWFDILSIQFFCYVELPLMVGGKYVRWDRVNVDEFMTILYHKLGPDTPMSYKFEHIKKRYYYCEDRTYPMVKLFFKNIKSMRKCTNILKNPLLYGDYIKFHVWDKLSIPELLLTKQLKCIDFYHVRATKVEPNIHLSLLDHEYIGEWDTINNIPHEVGWYTKSAIH
jgi:hypothetical protein